MRLGHYISRTYPFAVRRDNEACEIAIYFSKKMYVSTPEINGKQDIFQGGKEREKERDIAIAVKSHRNS